MFTKGAMIPAVNGCHAAVSQPLPGQQVQIGLPAVGCALKGRTGLILVRNKCVPNLISNQVGLWPDSRSYPGEQIFCGYPHRLNGLLDNPGGQAAPAGMYSRNSFAATVAQ